MPRSIIRYLLAALLALASLAAYAQTCTQYRIGGTYGPTWMSSKDAACADWFANARAAGMFAGNYTYIASETYCYLDQTSTNFNGTVSHAYSNYNSYQTQQGTCGPVCVTGTIRKFNLTMGWNRGLNTDHSYPDRMPDGSVPPNNYMALPPNTGCFAGCQQAFQSVNDAWVSETPVNGMYRVSVDATYMSIATPCTPSASDAAMSTPSTTAPACDGSVGLINGKTACVPTSLGQTNLTQGDKPTSVTKAGNPQAGSTGGTENIPTTGTGTSQGGPKLPDDGQIGINPGSGPGGKLGGSSGGGTTPVTVNPTVTGDVTVKGQCGGAGQPACAIAGQCGGPGQPACSVTVTGQCGGVGQPACSVTLAGQCGGPGQPKCEVSGQCGGVGQPACKIDTEGMPTEADATTKFGGIGQVLDDAKKTSEDAINGALTKSAPGWSWTFQLPSGCSPVTVGIANIVVDMCQWGGMIKDLMSMIWVITTVFTVIGMTNKGLG